MYGVDEWFRTCIVIAHYFQRYGFRVHSLINEKRAAQCCAIYSRLVCYLEFDKLFISVVFFVFSQRAYHTLDSLGC